MLSILIFWSITEVRYQAPGFAAVDSMTSALVFFHEFSVSGLNPKPEEGKTREEVDRDGGMLCCASDTYTADHWTFVCMNHLNAGMTCA